MDPCTVPDDVQGNIELLVDQRHASRPVGWDIGAEMGVERKDRRHSQIDNLKRVRILEREEGAECPGDFPCTDYFDAVDFQLHP